MPDDARHEAALDVVADRMSRVAEDMERTNDAVAWSLAGARHTAEATSNGLVVETVLAEGCSLGVRECEQLLAGANRYLTLTRWLVDADSRAIVARSGVELSATTWPWAVRAFAVACAVHAGFGAMMGAEVLQRCEPAKLHADQTRGEALLRAIQEHFDETDLANADLEVTADTLRRQGTGLCARSGEHLHVPLGAGTYGATLDLRFDEHHPALGVGLLVLLTVPGGGDRDVDHRLAAALNRSEEAGLGPWIVADDSLQHAVFLPAVLLDDATQRSAVLTGLALAELRRARRLTGASG